MDLTAMSGSLKKKTTLKTKGTSFSRFTSVRRAQRSSSPGPTRSAEDESCFQQLMKTIRFIMLYHFFLPGVFLLVGFWVYKEGMLNDFGNAEASISSFETWRDMFYFTVVTATTVGYGDMFPKSTSERLFTMAYALIWIVVLAEILYFYSEMIIKWHAKARAMAMQKALKGVGNIMDKAGLIKNRSMFFDGQSIRDFALRQSVHSMRIMRAVLPAIVVLLMGTVLHFTERNIPGAEDWTVMDSIWWSFCTITTIGYGDLSPKSNTGRWFAIFYIPIGVVAFTKSVYEAVVEKNLGGAALVTTKGTLEALDKVLERRSQAGQNRLTKNAYIVSMLVDQCGVDQSLVDTIASQFDKMDADGNGELNHLDVEALQRKVKARLFRLSSWDSQKASGEPPGKAPALELTPIHEGATGSSSSSTAAIAI
jgi:hypothetical protein